MQSLIFGPLYSVASIRLFAGLFKPLGMVILKLPVFNIVWALSLAAAFFLLRTKAAEDAYVLASNSGTNPAIPGYAAFATELFFLILVFLT